MAPGNERASTRAQPARELSASFDMRMTPAAHRLCLWGGHLCTVLYMGGFLLAGFLPIPGPDWPADKLAHWLADNKTVYQIGCLLMLLGAGAMGPWGAALSIWTRKTEARFPVIYIAQIVSLAASVALFIVIEIFWSLAAFRATEISVEITQMLYDAGWYFFLWIGPPFYIWVATFAIGILMNPPEHQMFPRWIGYFSLASVLCWGMGTMMVFFRSGPTSYSGMLPTWIPLIEFYIWMQILTYYGFRAVRLQEEACRKETEEGMGVYAPKWNDPLVASVSDPSSGDVAEQPSNGMPTGRTTLRRGRSQT